MLTARPRDTRVRFCVFTKPWKQPLDEMADFLARVGFDGVELTVRDGCQVEPASAVRDLPRAVERLRAAGLDVFSVASPLDENMIDACGEAGVPLIRVCWILREDETYLDMEARTRREFDALLPALERRNVTVGIQNHCGRQVPHALAIRRLVEPYDPRRFAAVWDAAHAALVGEPVDMALDIVWSHLAMVNLKNVVYLRENGPEAEVAAWRHYWTSGRQGLASWPRVAEELIARGYRGPVCLTAEYSDRPSADRLIAEDFAFARSLFARA